MDQLTAALLGQSSSQDDRRALIAQYIENNRYTEIDAAIQAGDPGVVSQIYQTTLDLGGPLPPPMIESTIAYISASGARCEPLAVRSMAGVRTKEAITPVVALLSIEGLPDRLQAEVLTTLREQTGIEDLGGDPSAWGRWWEEARWLPPREWEAMLAVAHAERARRLQRETDLQAARILDLHRRMYGLTPQDQRSALLATMMNDTEPGVRALAFELAERALLNSQRLDEQVRLAAVARLADQTPSIRASAASLLFRLGAGAEATEAVRRAIRREADPTAAAALLEFLRRRPNETDLMICLDWLGDQEPAASAAARTLMSSAVSGGLTRPMIRNLAIDSLRVMDPAALSPGKVELWGVLGGVEDRERLTQLLDSGYAPATRRAAASAIVRWPDSVEVLRAACERDAAFFPMLADAITLHEPTAEGYRTLAQVGGVAAETMTPRLVRLRRAIAPAEMLASIGEDESRASVIESVLFDPDHRDLLRRDPRLVLTQALITARYEAGNDQGIIELLGQVDQAAAGMLDEATTRIERRALICLGRFDEADTTGADESDWRAAAERSQRLALEQSPQILEEIATRFSVIEDVPSGGDDNPDTTAPPSEGVPGDGMIGEILTLEPSRDTSGSPGKLD